MAEMKTLNGNTFVDQTARGELATLKQTVSGIPKFSIEVVTVLPTIMEASTETVYLVRTGGSDNNIYTEWICVEHEGDSRAWEKLGTQNLDLTGYVTDEELSAAVEAALAQAKASGEFDGEKGEPGASVTVSNVTTSSDDGGSNVVTFSDGKTLTVKNGSKGANGKSAYAYAKDGGYAGTEAEFAEDINPDSINANAQNFIVTEMAKRGQLKPEFANSVEELNEKGDTTKLYVLPDGYLYAYVKKTVTVIPVNQIKESINSDGSQYVGTNGEDGYKTGYRLNSSGAEVTGSGYSATGFIPAKFGDTLRFSGIVGNSNSNTKFIFYDASFAALNLLQSTDVADIFTSGIYSITDNLVNHGLKVSIENMAYVRISAVTINANSVITVNQSLEPYTTTTQDWHNTGHAFVPADYEEEIINLNRRVGALETDAGERVDNYVIEAAERVAKNVYSRQNADTFTFLAISDAHYLVGDSNIEKSVIHAGQGMDLVRKNANIDFAVCLGDNGWGSGATGVNRATIEKGIKEIRSTNACIDSAFRGIPNFRSVGNHDSLIYNYSFNGNDYLDADELFPLYGAYNRGAVFHNGNKERGYCYRDFEDWKLRVICLNTSDLKDLTPSDSARPICVSTTQGRWFAETLDMSSKTNASEWSILILSHAPLDWGKACIYLCDILKAYVEGGTCNAVTHDGVTITYNYSGKNAATIIGNCHGHNHNFKVDYLRRLVSGSTTEAISIKRFCIPNACFERSNERGENGLESGTDGVFDIEYGEETSYEKVAGTEKDTAFCVVTIDPVARKIYADSYGAGYDREISY